MFVVCVRSRVGRHGWLSWHHTIRQTARDNARWCGARKFLDFRRTCKDCCKREDCFITNISVYTEIWRVRYRIFTLLVFYRSITSAQINREETCQPAKIKSICQPSQALFVFEHYWIRDLLSVVPLSINPSDVPMLKKNPSRNREMCPRGFRWGITTDKVKQGETQEQVRADLGRISCFYTWYYYGVHYC